MVHRELHGPEGRSTRALDFDLLAIFLARPNRVLSRDLLVELTQRREAPAYDRSIDVRVSRLRQVLGDGARDSRILQTVYGEGYILTSQVETIADACAA